MIDRRESFTLMVGAAMTSMLSRGAEARPAAPPGCPGRNLTTSVARTSLAKPDRASTIGFMQAGADGTVRTVQDKARETASVQDFGAIGDGVADDTLAIRKALASGAGAIFLPRGIYILESASAQDIHLYGPGTLRKKSGTKGVLLNLTGENRIEDVTLDYFWEKAAQTLPYSDNITLQQVGGSLTLCGVAFRRSFASAIFVSGASLSTDVNCSFTQGAPHNGLSGGKERVVRRQHQWHRFEVVI